MLAELGYGGAMLPSFPKAFIDGTKPTRMALSNDLTAALIVTIMFIPQSLAYALLAGLPAEAGLYASIVTILLYTVFGTSNSLAVGPVAVVSLMTAAAQVFLSQFEGVSCLRSKTAI